jgi:hypothetical protein
MANRLTKQLGTGQSSCIRSDIKIKSCSFSHHLSPSETTILTVLFFITFIFGSALDVFFSDRIPNFIFLRSFSYFYILQYSIIFFANTALVGAAMIRLQAADPTVSDGFEIAWTVLPRSSVTH